MHFALDSSSIDDEARAIIEAHSANLAACMITYPSTHGVFETTVREICEITHKHGGCYLSCL